jgi:DNA end-binding protein Ku
MVSFGLVSIPVKLYSTGESASGIQFNMLHRDCGTRLKQQYYCPTHDQVVSRDDMVKGYEYSKGQYVLFTDAELKALIPEATNAIDITEFVPLERVDPVYFEKSYYLGPDKGGERPYRLLAEAMNSTGRAAVGRYAARGKNYLVLLRPFEGGLVLQQLRYQDELRDFSEVPVAPAEIKEPELKLAVQLIEQISTNQFKPEQYEDEVRQRTRELIDRKIAGEEISVAPVEAPRAQIIDLMSALKASLEAAAPAAAPTVSAGRPAEPKAAPAGKAKRAEPAAEPAPVAARKPPKRSPRTPAQAPAGTGEAKRKRSKR